MAETLMVEVPGGPWLRVTSEGGQIRSVEFVAVGEGGGEPPSGVLAEAAQQLLAYFAGELRHFELPLAPEGTAFERRVWDAVAAIPYGATRSYAEIAQAVGSPGAARAVGAANGANPLPIVVPCHRVVGSNGALTGYGGGLKLKRRLLDLESGQSRFGEPISASKRT
jgi:methylated-DNA-[protein]-cysteine S-methyltransferase